MESPSHLPVGHYHVAALPFNPESNPHEGSNGSLVVDAGATGNLYRHLNLTQLDLKPRPLSLIEDLFLAQSGSIRNVIEIFRDGSTDILYRFFRSSAL